MINANSSAAMPPKSTGFFSDLSLQIDLSSSNPWNLPNWKDAKAYPDSDSKPISRWRWEFTRRDVDYRRHWLEYQDNRPAWDHAAPDERTRGEIVAREFALRRLISPACPFSVMVEGHMWHACPVALPLPDEVAAVCELAQKYGFFVTAIDPYGPIKDQLKQIEKSVQTLLVDYLSDEGRVTEKQKWPDRQKWPLYLRMLDARDDLSKYINSAHVGASLRKLPSYDAIAKVLKKERQPFSANKESVSKQYKYATEAQRKFLKWLPVEAS